jgi:C4-dicarboxylate-specific signal transduction histidine kinase
MLDIPFHTNKQEGIGLGMMVTNSISLIRIESELHQGTTFTILLTIQPDIE